MTETVVGVSRRAERRRARRRRNVRTIAALLSVLALLAVGVAIYFAARDTPPPSAPQASGERTQRTLSVQVQGTNGAGLAGVLFAHDPATTTGGAVLIPPQVLVTLPGSGSVPYGRALLSSTAEASRGALSDLLGVTVDAGWILDQPTLAALVDALGGIPVEVDAPVVQAGNVVLSPGSQQLDGASAALFQSYLAPGELEQVRMARVQEVLDGILVSLPADEAQLATVLAGLGDRSVSTLAPDALAGYLLGLAADDQAGQLQYDLLPVVDQDPGGGVVSFRVDEAAAQRLVDRSFAASVPEGARAGGNRFLVLNGVGTPGLGEAVRKKLVAQGFVFVSARNAPEFGVEQTRVLVPTATTESQELGERVAEALGVPASSIGSQDIGTLADVVVLVGADFTPAP